MTQAKTEHDVRDTAKSQLGDETCLSSSGDIYVSGQIGSTSDGTIPPCYESQIQLALLKLRKILAGAGAEVHDINKLTAYILDFDVENPIHERHFAKFLDSHRPAVTIIPVQRLTVRSALIQVEAVISRPPTSLRNHFVARSTLNAGKFYNPRIEKLYDAIVVGAGLSGLAAARDITAAGLSCLVIEARDRVGGKTLSVPMSKTGSMAELGGAWLNDTTETRMIGLARKYGAELIEQNTDGNAVLQDQRGVTTIFPYGGLPQVRCHFHCHFRRRHW